MDLQTSKIELAKMILGIDNQLVIDKMLQVLKADKNDFWLELSDNERKNIELGIRQLDNGEGTELKGFIKNIS